MKYNNRLKTWCHLSSVTAVVPEVAVRQVTVARYGHAWEIDSEVLGILISVPDAVIRFTIRLF
jgi:hypothetical protein